MKYTQLGQSDLQVSEICLGTMTFGQQNTEAEAFMQLDYAREQGINFIDTAEMYPVPPRAETVHQTERIVGSWLKQQARDKLIIATKVTGAGRQMNWIRDGELAFNRKNIRAAINGSLERLQTDYIDLYQLHWPERNVPMFGSYLYDPAKERNFTPVTETLEVLAELVDEGKIRYLGLSNEWPWGLMQFLNAARELKLPRIVSIQNAYNLINRTYETALLEMCHREEVSLLAYSPLAFGHLSGKYQQQPDTKGRINLFKKFGQRYEKPLVQSAVKAYTNLASQYKLTPTQLALSFVYSRFFTASTIIGATTMEQLKENIGAYTINWTEEMEQAVQKLHLRYFNPAP
jgi:aryl-alcohol dehydrogenase-like predicted oxidoreductase